MQKDLDLQVPFDEPRLDEIGDGGYRIGETAPTKPKRTVPAPKPDTNRERKTQPAAGSSRPSDADAPASKSVKSDSLYVANLPWETTDDDVARLFERFGDVHQVTIITDRRTGRSKGFAFVDMPQPAARSAIAGLHATKFDGRDLTVRFAKPRNHRG